MHKVIAYQHNLPVGYGYIITYPNGNMSLPELFDVDGNKLTGGLYQLSATDSYRLVVVPRNIQ